MGSQKPGSRLVLFYSCVEPEFWLSWGTLPRSSEGPNESHRLGTEGKIWTSLLKPLANASSPLFLYFSPFSYLVIGDFFLNGADIIAKLKIIFSDLNAGKKKSKAKPLLKLDCNFY